MAPTDQPANLTEAAVIRSDHKMSDFWRRLALAGLAISLSLLFGAVAIFVSGKNPVLAYWSLLKGAFGSVDSIAFALNKSTPYILTGVGVALCFRARVINIGGEGQIAVGGLAAAWAALGLSAAPAPLVPVLAAAAGVAAGALWAG